MVLTLSKVRSTIIGNMRLKIYDVTFDNSYPTGGESLTPADLGLNHIEAIIAEGGAYNFGYDYTNEKLKAFYGNNDAASDGPLVEVANATDLSSVSTRIVVIGR